MILTCPACDTKYVVKDGAIPPGGRKVRCASCKHSWHQDPEADTAPIVEPDPLPNPLSADLGGPPQPDAQAVDEFGMGEPTPQAVSDAFIAETPEPKAFVDTDEPNAWRDEYPPTTHDPRENAAASDEPADKPAVYANPHPAEANRSPAPSSTSPAYPQDTPTTDAPIEQREVEPLSTDGSTDADDVGFVVWNGGEDEAPRRRWPWIIGLLLLLAAAATAFWFYAPAEWKQRAGIAQSQKTPLLLAITTSDRQPLSSGNELLAISGKVSNPTDVDQDVPPIQAELRNSATKKVVHRWTIQPPAKVLAPGSSASFNSAEVGIPPGGDEISIRLGA